MHAVSSKVGADARRGGVEGPCDSTARGGGGGGGTAVHTYQLLLKVVFTRVHLLNLLGHKRIRVAHHANVIFSLRITR